MGIFKLTIGFGIGLGIAWGLASLSACTGAIAYKNMSSKTRAGIDEQIDYSLGLMEKACETI